MKIKIFLTAITSFLFLQITVAQVNDPGQVAKDAATNNTNSNMNNAANNGVNKVENGIKGLFKKKNKTPKTDSSKTQTTTPTATNSGTTNADVSAVPDVKTYQNYDFVPGDSIVFYDDFTGDQ
ncbi:MAG TPA: hypothetical protein VHZ50_00055, partial [Puia sp.]|nr:hypothetical protein [Puia sp.]